MINIIAIGALIFSIFFLLLSKSKSNYAKLVENNGEEFAIKITKTLKICGLFLLLFSIGFFVFGIMGPTHLPI